MKPAVFSPAARSRSRCSMGRRISAWVPVRKTRPAWRGYLSSSATDGSVGKGGCARLLMLVSGYDALWAGSDSRCRGWWHGMHEAWIVLAGECSGYAGLPGQMRSQGEAEGAADVDGNEG